MRALASLAVAPLLFAAYPLYLWARRGRPVAVPARAAALEPAPLAGRAARRDLGRPARGLGRGRAARVRLAHARLLDAGAGRRPDPRGRAEPRGARLPRALRRAGRDRLAALRRAVRPLRGAQPGDPAERAERALAAALAAALRPDDLPALPRARRARAAGRGHTRRSWPSARCCSGSRSRSGRSGSGSHEARARCRSRRCSCSAGTACGERTEPTGALVAELPGHRPGRRRRRRSSSAAPQRIVPVGAGPAGDPASRSGSSERTTTVDDTLVGLPLVDAIRRAKPDLIVASSETDPLDLARARSATHAPVYVEPGGSVGDVVQAIGEIGLLTGRPVAGTAADGPDRGEAPGRRQGGRRHAARDRVRRHRRLLDHLQPHPARRPDRARPRDERRRREPGAGAVPAQAPRAARPRRLPRHGGQRTDARTAARPGRREAPAGGPLRAASRCCPRTRRSPGRRSARRSCRSRGSCTPR